MIYFINTIIIILAIVVALNVSNEAKKYLTSVAIIMMGIGLHTLEAYTTFNKGNCEINENVALLSVIDSCINYESKVIIYSQAFIIGGFIVIFIGLALSNKH